MDGPPLPSYDEVVDGRPRATARSSRLRIESREDKGRERLPGYSCSIMTQSIFFKKNEYESAIYKARHRGWNRVFVELRGTALRISTVKTGVVQSNPDDDSPDMPAFMKAGKLVKIYTLQHGDVGMATDYEKRRYVIRLRVETDQFLLSCLEISTLLHWLESLSAAIALSLPLDDRQIPREAPLPRHRRRRVDAISEQEELQITDSHLILEQQEIMTARFPHLAAGGSSSASIISGVPFDSISPRVAHQESLILNFSRYSVSYNRRLSRSSSYQISRVNSASQQQMSEMNHAENWNPSVSPETGKWEPQHTWTRQQDTMFAKRCMAILLKESPRKTNFVIVRGKQWIIDWFNGRLERYEPPGYEEKLVKGKWMLARNCTMQRIG